MYMYAYVMHIVDYVTSYWDPDALTRYNKFKREQILEQNRKNHFKRKLEKLNLTSYEYKSVKEYIQNEIQCSNTEVDEILESSVNSGVDLTIPSRWVLLQAFSRSSKIHMEDLKSKYRPTSTIYHHSPSNYNWSASDDLVYQIDE
jgi:hypothetical protein